MKSLRLFLFSDHRIAESRSLDNRIIEVAGTACPSVAWIPSGATPEKTKRFFEQRRDYYADLGVTDFDMFPLHEEFSESRIPWLLSRNIIHLSGGDPFIFLQNLRRTGVLQALRTRAQQGGITVGDSGGAMLMTATIEITRFGHIPIPAGLTDLSSLGLVDFEFHPHFGRYGASAKELKDYSRKHGVIVYAASDGCALAVLNGKIQPHGPVVRFKDGSEEPMTTASS